MRRVYLYRHGEAQDRDRSGERVLDGYELSSIPRTGAQHIARLGLNPEIVGVSNIRRTHTTAKLFTSRVHKNPQLITHGFLDELPLARSSASDRYELIEMLRHGRAPEEYQQIGERILEELTTSDPRINIFFTHGSVLAAVQVAKRAKLGSDLQNVAKTSLVIPPLVSVQIDIEVRAAA